jgi:hypothetical protein
MGPPSPNTGISSQPKSKDDDRSWREAEIGCPCNRRGIHSRPQRHTGRIELPTSRNVAQLCLAARIKCNARPNHEILHVPRNQNFSCSSVIEDTRRKPTQSLEYVRHPRKRPRIVEIGDKARNVDYAEGTIADHLIGNVQTATLRISRAWMHSASISRPSSL